MFLYLLSGNDHQVAVSGQENDLMDDTCQSANKKITISGISKSCGIPITSASQNGCVYSFSHSIFPVYLLRKCDLKVYFVYRTDTAMEVIEIEPLELTSHPCSKEVIPESNGIMFLYDLKAYFEVYYVSL